MSHDAVIYSIETRDQIPLEHIKFGLFMRWYNYVNAPIRIAQQNKFCNFANIPAQARHTKDQYVLIIVYLINTTWLATRNFVLCLNLAKRNVQVNFRRSTSRRHHSFIFFSCQFGEEVRIESETSQPFLVPSDSISTNCITN